MTSLGKGAAAPKRFYEHAALKHEQGVYVVSLDGRLAKTPERAPLGAPFKALVAAIVEEWNRVEETIDMRMMPLTKLLTTAIDLAPLARDAWRDAVIAYLRTDLTCYRASEPQALALAQKGAWDPLIEQWSSRFSASLQVTEGVIAVDQASETLDQASAYLEDLSNERLTAVKTATELSGSAVIGMLLMDETEILPEALFAASRIDENFQEQRWGVDAEAKRRENDMKADFLAVAQFTDLLRKP